mmetsp:Transcript_26588/g.32261  ORF Transcript_26588/g.32261 Transcript_26588/m.32261 type:complete len:135 (+) Transcript_26588:133-537(+)
MQALFGMLAGGGEVDKTVYPVQKTDAEWKKQLGSRDFNILRQGGTERGGTGEYNDFYPDSGYFACKGCGFPLYSATSKFEDCGWIAFDKCYHSGDLCHVGGRKEYGQMEMHCNNCGGHMGHVFYGERGPSSERH